MEETVEGTAPTEIVIRFLDLLAAGDVDAACDLLADDVRYINVSLPEMRGQDQVRRIFRKTLGREDLGLEVYVHRVGLDRGSVLTERTDVFTLGPVRIQVWVWGRSDVADGRIVMWKDYFDWWNVTVATLRGLLGAALPSLAARPPAV